VRVGRPVEPVATLRAGPSGRVDKARPSAGSGQHGLGWHVGEQVRAAARRRRPGRAGGGPLGWEPQVGEDPADHPRILNGRDQAHAAAAARAGQDIHVEGAPHEVSPGPVARWGGRLALELRDGGRGGVSHGCSQRKARLLIGDGAGAPASMGGKDAVVHHEIDARARSQGGELFKGVPGARRAGGR